LPYLQPFNGVNARSIVVMDNASIHHSSSVVNSIESTGALVQFLPPYSPDLNPIEMAFSKVKSVLKSNEENWKEYDVETAVIAALNVITKSDCEGWIKYCGY
jgi:transposase